MGGIGAAAGPLIGGLITTAISWRAAFVFQAAVVATIIFLSRRINDPLPADPTRPFDAVGAVLSAVGMFFLVFGILQADNNNTLMVDLPRVGAALLVVVLPPHPRAGNAAGKEPLLSTGLFRNRTSNLGLVTQNIQWLLLMGVSFVVSVFLQTERGYDAIQTGVIFTAATAGRPRLVARRGAARQEVRADDPDRRPASSSPSPGSGSCSARQAASSSTWAFAPGLLVIGLGLGRDAHPVGQHRAVQLPRGASRARSPACRAASPTSARRSAPRSPARSWSPISPRATAPTSPP